MSKRILLCDDELYVLRAAEIKFKRAGYTVHAASDGEEAWEALQASPVDVIVTDCQMPKLDGLGLARRIQESAQFRNIPIVMLTAKGFELSRQELKDDYGIQVLFSKPFSPRVLLRTVEELLGDEAAKTPASNTNPIKHTTT